MASVNLRDGEFGGSDSEQASGTGNTLSRQPTVFDYSQTNQFRIFLPIFPTTEWFVISANIPGVSLGQATQATPYTDMPIVGDKIGFDSFDMTFIVDEQLKNYMEMYNWVKNIGFPYSGNEQFNRLARADNLDRTRGTRRRPESVGKGANQFVKDGDRNLYTDIRLDILSSKNNTVANVYMYEAFPISLSGIDYSQQETDITYATCAVSFAYSWFDVLAAKSSATV